MSGGVDSSVCAYLLKKWGYEVIGVFMQNWDTYVNNDLLGHVKNQDKQCNVYKDFSDAKSVADKLGIKIYKVDFIKEYWENVFKHTIDQYKQGLTPNPDVLCNKYIKFGSFIEYAKKKFSCDRIAMGHYAGTKKKRNINFLVLSRDKMKDQTYFLCNLSQEQVNSCIFPLQHITKSKVRKIAKKIGLVNHDKTESTGICFIGERKFQDFLQNYIKPNEGKVVDIISKKTIGTHKGVYYYTIGQNKNLNLGGNKEKYFVCDKNLEKNIIYVVNEESKDKYLSSDKCIVSNFNFINGNIFKKCMSCKIRFRHRQKLVSGRIMNINNDTISIKYKPTLSVTPGQYAVIYKNKVCIGGGVVTKIN